jgi:Replicative DNA helicase
VAGKPNQGSSLKKVNVAQDLALKLQILLGVFSLDMGQKKLIFWQITQFLTSRKTKHELLYGTHMGF